MSLSSSRSGSGLVLLAVSAAVLGAAVLLWETRSRAANISVENATFANNKSSTRLPADASALLKRSFQADHALRYSADVQISAMYGEHKMETRAHLMRAPRRLTVTYISGDRRGLEGGYNERWFWRRESKDAPMQAYASVAYRPAEMAAQRFALMTRNYRGTVLRRENVNARACDVVEVRRKQELPDTKGPFKRLWLDRESGLTLRADTFNCRGNLVQRSVVSNLKLQPEDSSQKFVAPAKMFAIAEKSDWKTEELGADRVKVAAMTKLSPPQPQWIPAGFAFDSVGMQRTSLAKNAPMAALSRYGDGLNVITIFVFQTPSKAAKTPDHISCTFGAGAMAMRETPGGLTLIAIGDLPTATLNRILDSVLPF